MNDATKEELLEILNEKQEEIQWLKSELDEANHSRELSDADCVTLRKERDEARREVCKWEAEDYIKEPVEEVAKRKGWDCFKEGTNVESNT